MKKADFIIAGIILLQILIALGAFVVDSYIYDDVVTVLVSSVLLYVLFKAIVSTVMIILNVSPSHTYVIKKGNNYSGWRFKPFWKPKGKEVEVTLHKSCKVETQGLQKIFGMGDIDHHINSFRFAYRYDSYLDLFHIYEYVYQNGAKIEDELVLSCRPETPVKLYITDEIAQRYTFGKYLFPYFEQDGEDELGAPQEMRMTLTVRSLS